jgi:MFS superfamily sulfate permease-like transporter
VLAGIVFTIAVGMIDVTGLRDIRRESPGEFYLALVTAAAVVAIGVEQGILLAMALSLFRHVRHSYSPHTMMLAPNAIGRWTPVPATPGKETEPGLVVYRFGADLFYANASRFVDEVRALVQHAPTPVRWFIVDAGAITDIDYSASQAIRALLDDLARQSVGMVIFFVFLAENLVLQVACEPCCRSVFSFLGRVGRQVDAGAAHGFPAPCMDQRPTNSGFGSAWQELVAEPRSTRGRPADR